MRFSYQSAEPEFSAWIPSSAQNGHGGNASQSQYSDLIQEEKMFTCPLLNSDPEIRTFVRIKKHAKKGRRRWMEDGKDIRKVKEILNTNPEVH